jgi:hypothetical protein
MNYEASKQRQGGQRMRRELLLGGLALRTGLGSG